MQYNPYFPTSYPGVPQIPQMMQQAPQVQPAQNFSRPTIHADIVQIDGDREEAEAYPVSTGGTQMMINKAEDKIFIKTVYANNQVKVDEFVKQALAPKQPPINYDDFVTWDKLEKRLAEIKTEPERKEAENNEHVSESWKRQSNANGNTSTAKSK